MQAAPRAGVRGGRPRHCHDIPARPTTHMWPSWPTRRLHSSGELYKPAITSVSSAPQRRWPRLRPGGYGPGCLLLGGDRPIEGGAVKGIEGRDQCRRSSGAGEAAHVAANAPLGTPRSRSLPSCASSPLLVSLAYADGSIPRSTATTPLLSGTHLCGSCQAPPTRLTEVTDIG